MSNFLPFVRFVPSSLLNGHPHISNNLIPIFQLQFVVENLVMSETLFAVSGYGKTRLRQKNQQRQTCTTTRSRYVLHRVWKGEACMRAVSQVAFTLLRQVSREGRRREGGTIVLLVSYFCGHHDWHFPTANPCEANTTQPNPNNIFILCVGSCRLQLEITARTVTMALL